MTFVLTTPHPTFESILESAETNDPGLTTLAPFWLALDDSQTIRLAEKLKRNNKVIALLLSNNAIGDEGAVALAEALTGNTTVQYIHLSVNNIGDVGAVAFAKALPTMTSLKQIIFIDNMIGAAGVAALNAAKENHPTLKKVDLLGQSSTEEPLRFSVIKRETAVQQDHGNTVPLKNGR